MKLITESQIRGSFRGWKGHSVYKLLNGEYWKQSKYVYHYHYAYQPKAKIWQDGSTYYLEVEGINDKLEVRKASSSDWDEYQKEEGDN